MPQQPFVMRVHFYLPEGSGRQSLQSGAHHVEYMGSREKEELLLSAPAHDDTTLESASIHAKYAGERVGSMGYLGSLAHDPRRAQESILHAQGPVWRVIASVAEEDAQAMGGALLTKAGWDHAVPPVVEKMIATLGVDPAKTQWIAAVHRHQHHEQNPHIHLLIWEEGTPSRKTAKWSRDELRSIKRDWVSSLYAPERTQLGQTKTAARKQARQHVMDLMAHRDRRQGFDQELAQRLAHIGQGLPGKGRLAYAYMPPEVKMQVSDTIRWLWSQDPGLKKAHDAYIETAERMGTFYWHTSEAKSQNPVGRQKALNRIRERAEQDLIQRLAAPVLKAAQRQHRAVARDEYSEASHAIREFLRDETQAERLAPWIRRFQSEGPTDEALIALVQESRTWPEREQWLSEWIESGARPEAVAQSAWDTVVQSVVQNAARQAQREEVKAAWDEALAKPEKGQELWAIAEQYAQSARSRAEWQAALQRYHAVLPVVSLAGGDLATQRFARHLAHHVQWLDEHHAIAQAVTDQDLRWFRRDPAAVVERVIRGTPALQQPMRSAGMAFMVPEPFVYRYAHEYPERPGEWSFTERTFTDRGGPLLQASFPPFDGTSAATPFPFPVATPPGIMGSLWNPVADAQARQAAQDTLRERVAKHLTSLGYEQGIYRYGGNLRLTAVLTHLIRGDMASGRSSAYALKEAQWKRKQAELAIAQNTGQQIVL